jgi:long-chain acyl-CoA synthetase
MRPVRRGEDFDPAALKQGIQEILPYDLNPLDILRVREFPMTPTGKIAKAERQDQAIAGTIRVA